MYSCNLLYFFYLADDNAATLAVDIKYDTAADGNISSDSNSAKVNEADDSIDIDNDVINERNIKHVNETSIQLQNNANGTTHNQHHAENQSTNSSEESSDVKAEMASKWLTTTMETKIVQNSHNFEEKSKPSTTSTSPDNLLQTTLANVVTIFTTRPPPPHHKSPRKPKQHSMINPIFMMPTSRYTPLNYPHHRVTDGPLPVAPGVFTGVQHSMTSHHQSVINNSHTATLFRNAKYIVLGAAAAIILLLISVLVACIVKK